MSQRWDRTWAQAFSISNLKFLKRSILVMKQAASEIGKAKNNVAPVPSSAARCQQTAPARAEYQQTLSRFCQGSPRAGGIATDACSSEGTCQGEALVAYSEQNKKGLCVRCCAIYLWMCPSVERETQSLFKFYL